MRVPKLAFFKCDGVGSCLPERCFSYPKAHRHSARWLVPKMVKNGICSYSVFSRLIWACSAGESWPCPKTANRGFQQVRVEVDFSINC